MRLVRPDVGRCRSAPYTGVLSGALGASNRPKHLLERTLSSHHRQITRDRHLLTHAQHVAVQQRDALLYMPALLKLLRTHALQGTSRVHSDGARAEVKGP